MATKYEGPEEFNPISAWGYFGWSLLFGIPIVGFIILIVFSCGGTSNQNLRNYARSHFCGLLVYGILVILILVVGSAVVGGLDAFLQELDLF